MKLLCHFIKESIYTEGLNKCGCEYVIKHFKDVCVGVGASFSIQIFEVFPGTGYKKNKVCPVNREARLDREDYWTETFRRSYPYVVNERKRKADPNLPVECSFSPIPRSVQRSAICRNNANFDNFYYMDSLFNHIHNYITDDIKGVFYHICILLKNARKKYLKRNCF